MQKFICFFMSIVTVTLLRYGTCLADGSNFQSETKYLLPITLVAGCNSVMDSEALKKVELFVRKKFPDLNANHFWELDKFGMRKLVKDAYTSRQMLYLYLTWDMKVIISEDLDRNRSEAMFKDDYKNI